MHAKKKIEEKSTGKFHGSNIEKTLFKKKIQY